jgi:hypothetical protein
MYINVSEFYISFSKGTVHFIKGQKPLSYSVFGLMGVSINSLFNNDISIMHCGKKSNLFFI